MYFTNGSSRCVRRAAALPSRGKVKLRKKSGHWEYS